MTRIVFASCMSALADSKQQVWSEAIAHQPDWLVLGGDNIYMDYFPHLNQSQGWPLEQFAAEMQLRYEKQFAVPTFRKLIESIPAEQIIGVWDDHDFAWNNCYGADSAHGMDAKKKIATAFYHHYFIELNRRPLALTLPVLSIADLNHPPNGTKEVYRALDISPFRVLLCDGRTWRGRHPTGTTSGSLLGTQQEAWLFAETGKSSGPFLLVTGSTMTAGDDQSWDYYQDFYKNRFLPAVQGKLVLFMAGDVHENRLPPRVANHPIEIVSSAAVLDFPFNKRNFGVLEIANNEVNVYLYRRNKIQYAGKLDLGSGKFKTTMTKLTTHSKTAVSVKKASAQRRNALRNLSKTK